MILFFDTETNKKANFKEPAQDPSQPNLVQLAAALVDEDLVIRHQICHVVCPDGWEISEEVAKIHGISEDLARKTGMHISRVLDAFAAMVDGAHLIIAHNLDFDKLVMDSQFLRFRRSQENPLDVFNAAHANWYCTMRAMTNVCKLRGQFGDYKFPKLEEAYLHATGKQLDGAHDAMADVRGCIAVYKYLRRQAALAKLKSGEDFD